MVSASFDEVYYTHASNSKYLRRLTEITPGQYPLLEEQKDWFLENSESFVSLRKLDLSGQNIDDRFIEGLCFEDFERLEEIDISSNPGITTRSLDYILESESLGRRRTYVDISETHGLPQSVIKICIDTICQEARDKYNRSCNYLFSMKYDRDPPTIAVKILILTKTEPKPCCQCRCHK